MLFVIFCANHPELTYRGGQGPIVHLEADLYRVIRWANGRGLRWAFSLSNAGAYYVEFQSSIDALDLLDWPAISATDFRDTEVKEHKQAEFLLYERFPFDLVDRIGVQSVSVRNQATEAIKEARHKPTVDVIPDWYF